MTIDVAGSPETENKLEIYRFQFVHQLPAFRLVGFKTYIRGDETAPWEQMGSYTYPDLLNHNTLPCPEIPDWAKLDAKTIFSQLLTFE